MPTSIFASRRLYSQYDPPFDLEDSSSLPTKYISTQQHADAMGVNLLSNEKKPTSAPKNVATKPAPSGAC